MNQVRCPSHERIAAAIELNEKQHDQIWAAINGAVNRMSAWTIAGMGAIILACLTYFISRI